jgi:molecular chaperone GrpE
MAENQDVTPDIEEEEAEVKSPETKSQGKNASPAAEPKTDYYDQLLRLRAEFENFRKRVEREKSEARAWGKQEVLLELIGLVDVFEQARTQVESAKDMKQVVAGLQMLHKNFAQFLKTEGLEPLNVVGKPFDPLMAEVLAQEEVEEDKVGQVLEEFQKGYLFHGKVLRPSRVRVGVAKKADESKTEE